MPADQTHPSQKPVPSSNRNSQPPPGNPTIIPNHRDQKPPLLETPKQIQNPAILQPSTQRSPIQGPPVQRPTLMSSSQKRPEQMPSFQKPLAQGSTVQGRILQSHSQGAPVQQHQVETSPIHGSPTLRSTAHKQHLVPESPTRGLHAPLPTSQSPSHQKPKELMPSHQFDRVDQLIEAPHQSNSSPTVHMGKPPHTKAPHTSSASDGQLSSPATPNLPSDAVYPILHSTPVGNNETESIQPDRVWPKPATQHPVPSKPESLRRQHPLDLLNADAELSLSYQRQHNAQVNGNSDQRKSGNPVSQPPHIYMNPSHLRNIVVSFIINF